MTSTREIPVVTSVLVGDARVVGTLHTDPSTIHGLEIRGREITRSPATETPRNANHGVPHMVIPLGVAMRARPAHETVALVALHACLTSVIGETSVASAAVDLIEGMPYRSHPDGHTAVPLSLEFPVPAAAFSALERERQELASSRSDQESPPFRLELQFSGRVAALITRGSPAGSAGAPADPLHDEFGFHSLLSMFWNTTIPPLMLDIDHDVWLNSVIPAFNTLLRRGR